MAIQNFIDGALYGKIGGFVGANWRGVDYMRAYAKPKQPDSPAQVLHKQNFKRLITIANSLHKVWFPYVFDEKPNKTLSNQFMTLNKGIYQTNGYDFDVTFPSNADSPTAKMTNILKYVNGIEFTRGFNYPSEYGEIAKVLYMKFCPELYEIAFQIADENNHHFVIKYPSNWNGKQLQTVVQVITSKYILKPQVGHTEIWQGNGDFPYY